MCFSLSTFHTEHLIPNIMTSFNMVKPLWKTFIGVQHTRRIDNFRAPYSNAAGVGCVHFYLISNVNPQDLLYWDLCITASPAGQAIIFGLFDQIKSLLINFLYIFILYSDLLPILRKEIYC